jgi:hypothetical protein
MFYVLPDFSCEISSVHCALHTLPRREVAEMWRNMGLNLAAHTRSEVGNGPVPDATRGLECALSRRS